MGITGKLIDKIDKLAKLRKEDKEHKEKEQVTKEQVRQAAREQLSHFD